MRRWIAAARSYSISCSVTAKASASKASGRPRGRPRGVGAQRRADQRVVAVRVVEGPQVEVDPERAAHARDRPLGVVPVGGLGAEEDIAAGELGDADQDRLRVLMDETVDDAAAAGA